MTTQTNTKVRLVRCPKCRQVLPEPDVPMYRCGGCAAILRAKNWRSNSHGTGLNHDGSDANGKEKVESVLDEREVNGTSERATVSAAEESSLSDSDCNRNPENGPNQEAISCAREPSPDTDNFHGEETTSSSKGESSPETESTRNLDDCRSEETTSSAKGESVSDTSGDNNQETAVSAGEEISPDINSERNGDDFQLYNGELRIEETSTPELRDYLQLSAHEDQDLVAESKEVMEQVQCDYNADQNMQESENESGDSERNCISGRSFSDDFYSSVEFLGLETEGSSPERAPNTGLHETKRTPGKWGGVDRIVSENCTREQHDEHGNCLVEGKIHYENGFSSKGVTFEQGASHINNECNFEDHRRETVQDGIAPKEISSSTEIVPVMPSPAVDANAQVVNENLSVHNFESLEKEEHGSNDADKNPLNGSILSDNLDSSDDQHLGISRISIPQTFGQRFVTESPDNMPFSISDSDFGLKHKELSKSPTKCYYGHDGTASSCDGFEERVPGRSAKPPRRKVKHLNSNNPNGLHIEGGGPQSNDSRNEILEMQHKPIQGSGLNEMLINESEIRHQARMPPVLPEKNHPTLKHHRTNQDDLLDPRNFDRPTGSRMREDREEHTSTVPILSPIYLQTVQRKSSSAPYPLSTFQQYSNFSSLDAPSYAEPDRMELLRMVNELKEELNRMQISNSRFPLTMSREEKFAPLYYDHHLPPVVERSSDLSYPRYPRRYSTQTGMPQLNHQPTRMAFSGEATDYMRRVDYPCLHCHPQDWHYSAQLPSHTICCNKVHCTGHSTACYNSPCSTSSSPHHYKSSEFSVWDRDNMSTDQRQRDTGMRNFQLREKQQSMKRYVRPVAGGNPILSCYHCSQLLQLPADFLLLGRRCHKLRCNACGKVLKFALQSGKHIVRCIPEAVAPPPSVVDYSTESILHHSNNNPEVEPTSCTDDYGISFARSYSTEGEPSSVLPPPLRPVGNNPRTRKMASVDNVISLEDRKMKSVLEEYQTILAETSSKRSTGRKSSSEIKEIPENGASPLHRLMGYPSPSAVMRN